ncbi:MAG TPA: hypothetical protein VNO81_00270 [Candidatus Nitrosotenuis sp.]|jgi:hypothetical protein|nr:hypothetical protein [Candidatus Nitrosotenuis sp.]
MKKGVLLLLLCLALLLGAAVPGLADVTRPVIVYFNPGEEVYHVKGCPSLRPGFVPISLQNAKNQGMTPDKACNAPQ